MDLREQLQATLTGSYTLERELTGGGMSRVFLAEDSNLRRKVVVKVLSPELAEGLSAERFTREIRVAASLQQANIVPVLSAGTTGKLPYYSMPFVEGESLRRRLADGPLAVAEVVSILRDVSRALAYAHARGVVHRDIKPDNVLISGGAAVVTDFGIAKAISASRTESGSATLTQFGTSIGTPAYMAPEQAAGDPMVDHRADLYSLGAMAYELLAGRPPFAGRTPQRTLAAHMTESPSPVTEFRPDCPPTLAELVTRLLQKDPSGRPQSAAEVLGALDSVTTSGSAVAMPPSLLGGPRSMGRLLAGYVAAFTIVFVVTKAAVLVIGLPDWVLPGAVVVMALGLPALLGTAYVQKVSRRAVTATPTMTPGGTMSPRVEHGTMATIAMKVSPHVSWRRTIRGGYIAIGAFVFVVAVYMVLRVLGIGPGRTLFAAGDLSANDKILISGFTFTPASDSAFAPILTEGVRNALGQSRAIRLVAPTEIAQTLERMKRPRNAVLDDNLAREVAERAGARAYVVGRMVSAGGAYVVSLELRRSATGDVLASAQRTADGTKDLISAVDALTRELRGKIGESLRAVNRSVALEQATTSSLEALRRFSEGTRANDVDNDFELAIRNLREAVALDSTFAVAWRKLGIALGNAGYPLAMSDTAFERAAHFAEKLPARERGIALGAYYGQHSTAFDRGKAIENYLAAYTADTNSDVAANQLMGFYGSRRDFPTALKYAHRQVAMRFDPSTAAFISTAFAYMGQPDSGQAVLKSIVSMAGPTAAEAYWLQRARVEMSYDLGRLDSIKTIGEAMRRSNAQYVRRAGTEFLSGVANVEGRLQKAASLDREASAMLASIGTVVAPLDSVRAAYKDIWFRAKSAEGVRRLDAALASPEYARIPLGTRPDLAVAALYARAGEPAKARAILARRESTAPTVVRGPEITSWHRARGEIALAEKRYDDAVVEFRKSDLESDGAPTFCEACSLFALARTFDAAKQVDSSITYYERYLKVTPALRMGMDAEALAATHKRLGELYDAKNDRARAVQHYTAFIEQWKDADPDLQPAVAAVRRRLHEIAAREGR